MWRLLFELLGRDFESWGDICRYFVDERKTLHGKAAELDRKAADQAKAIRALR